MTPEEIKQAQDLIDSVLNGTGELKPCIPVFPEKQPPEKEPLAEEGKELL